MCEQYIQQWIFSLFAHSDEINVVEINFTTSTDKSQLCLLGCIHRCRLHALRPFTKTKCIAFRLYGISFSKFKIALKKFLLHLLSYDLLTEERTLSIRHSSKSSRNLKSERNYSLKKTYPVICFNFSSFLYPSWHFLLDYLKTIFIAMRSLLKNKIGRNNQPCHARSWFALKRNTV